MMVGREVIMQPDCADVERGEARLELKGLHALSDRGTPALRGVNLDVQAIPGPRIIYCSVVWQ